MKNAEEIMRLFQTTNSPKYFEELVEYFKNPLYNYLFRFLGDRDTAEDILQETFIKVYRKKDLYNGSSKVSTWIYTIAGNLAKSEIAKKHRYKHISVHESDESNEQFEVESVEPLPEIVVDTEMKEQLVQAALLKVPEIYRETLVLRDIQELSYEEIAEMLEITVGTVKSRINRGRSVLQAELRAYFKED